MPLNGEEPAPDLPNQLPRHAPLHEDAIKSQPAPQVQPPVVLPRKDIELAWLHPTSMFFDVLSHGRQNLVPVAMAVWGVSKGSKSWLLFALFIFAISLLQTTIRYFTLRYQIKDGELTVREGLIFKRVRTVPLERIQNIDSTQKVLHRLFDVAEVRVETASGKEPEAVLRVLSLDRIAQLRETVFSLKPALDENAALAEPMAEDGALQTPRDDELVLHRISLANLVRAGVASNRGLLVFGVIAGAIFQFNLIDKLELNKLKQAVPQGLGFFETAMIIVILVLLFFLVTRAYGVIWYLLRFYGYRLALRNDDFRISSGLLTRVTATVPRERIQFISVHQPLFMRQFGLAAIRIETAGGSATENEDATSSMGRRWFIPVIEATKVNAILAQLRPGLSWDPEQVVWQGVSEKTAARLCRLAVIQSLLVAAVGLAIIQLWGWIAGVVALPFFIYWAIRKSRAMRYTEADFGVAYRSGVFTRKLSLTFFNRIQTLRMDQSPFDRRWNMATLSIDTAAAGPAEHRVNVKYLDAKVARQRFQELTKKLGLVQMA